MTNVIKGKRILVVDDERDVCQVIQDELSQCEVDTAETYDAAKQKLARSKYDVVILDIMGVRGYDLLSEFSRKAPCIMLTAHALSPQDLKTSMVGHAALYLPKEELGRIDEYIAKVLLVKEPLWTWLFKRLDFSKWFGKGWASFDLDFFKDFQLSEAEVMGDLQRERRD